jgi:hypothetical protein
MKGIDRVIVCMFMSFCRSRHSPCRRRANFTFLRLGCVRCVVSYAAHLNVNLKTRRRLSLQSAFSFLYHIHMVQTVPTGSNLSSHKHAIVL